MAGIPRRWFHRSEPKPAACGDGNGGEAPSKKGGRQRSSLLSKLPPLATLMRRQTDEATAAVSPSAATGSTDSRASSASPLALGQAMACSGSLLARVVSNDTGFVADAGIAARHDAGPAAICSSPGPTPSSAVAWSASSGFETALTTPGSTIHSSTHGTPPLRAGALPETPASPLDGKSPTSCDRRPSMATRSITWDVLDRGSRSINHISSIAAATPSLSSFSSSSSSSSSSETNLSHGSAATRVLTFDHTSRFASSSSHTRFSGPHYHQDPEIRKSVAPWSDDPKRELSEEAATHQKAAPEADFYALPEHLSTRPQGAPLEGRRSSEISTSVAKKKRSKKKRKGMGASSSGETMEKSQSMEGTQMPAGTTAVTGSTDGALERDKQTSVMEPMMDPGYDKWTELGKEQKTRQRRELVSGISSYNWSTAQRHRMQPGVEGVPIGPGGELAYADAAAPPPRNAAPAKPSQLSQLDAATLARALPAGDGISPRMVPATLPAAIEAVGEEEEIADSNSYPSTPCSASASDNDDGADPDAEFSAHANTTKATGPRKLSRPQHDSTRSSATVPAFKNQSTSDPETPRACSGSTDLDLINSRLVKAGAIEMKLSSSSRPSATAGDACECGQSRLVKYRSQEDASGRLQWV